MSIPERFQKLMESEHLSPAQFADEIGVQRSSLSHILSGRNNPGYDYLVKILKRFDNLDANWLLNGTGEMYKSEKPTSAIPQNQLFSLEEQKPKSPSVQLRPQPKEELQMREDKTTDNQSKIVKIVEYYSDDTFAVFYPKS